MICVDRFRMILKLLISASLLTFSLGHVAATTCHELQQSQLNSLNERMNQMIDTISSLLPKSLKKWSPPLPSVPVPSADYVTSTAGQEISYYIPPQPYSTPQQIPQLMYLPPSYAPTAAAVPQSRQPNPVPIPISNYAQGQTGPQPQHPLSMVSPYAPQPWFGYQYEQSPQYATSTPTPPLHPSGSYPLVQSPHPFEYIHPYGLEYPLPAPAYPNIPAFAPSLPLFPLPVQIAPGAYIPAYPQLSELPQNYQYM